MAIFFDASSPTRILSQSHSSVRYNFLFLQTKQQVLSTKNLKGSLPRSLSSYTPTQFSIPSGNPQVSIHAIHHHQFIHFLATDACENFHTVQKIPRHKKVLRQAAHPKIMIPELRASNSKTLVPQNFIPSSLHYRIPRVVTRYGHLFFCCTSHREGLPDWENDGVIHKFPNSRKYRSNLLHSIPSNSCLDP